MEYLKVKDVLFARVPISQTNLPFKFKLQIPVQLTFAMTTNKNLEIPYFSHNQHKHKQRYCSAKNSSIYRVKMLNHQNCIHLLLV